MARFIVRDLGQVTDRMKKEMEIIEKKLGRKVEFSEYTAISMNAIIERAKKDKMISLDDQRLIGAMMGYMLHDAYCQSRKLDKPNEQGLMYNPREKELSEEIDKDFVQAVLDGKIKQSKTLYVRDGKVYMDIANTEFSDLSPYWQKDNFGAGKCATMAIISSWKGLSHDSPEVREHVTIAVASNIHNNWISRGNVYRSVDKDGTVYTNDSLDTAYIYLIDEEKAKDLVHVQMASHVVGKLVEGIMKSNEAKEATATEVKADGPQTSGPKTNVPKANEQKPETPETGAPESGEPAGSQPGE